MFSQQEVFDIVFVWVWQAMKKMKRVITYIQNLPQEQGGEMQYCLTAPTRDHMWSSIIADYENITAPSIGEWIIMCTIISYLPQPNLTTSLAEQPRVVGNSTTPPSFSTPISTDDFPIHPLFSVSVPWYLAIRPLMRDSGVMRRVKAG